MVGVFVGLGQTKALTNKKMEKEIHITQEIIFVNYLTNMAIFCLICEC